MVILVYMQLFSRPAMLLKLTKVFHNKGSKASYCLACLISLIEQARNSGISFRFFVCVSCPHAIVG